MAVTEVKNPTPIEKDVEKAIRDRLFHGFNNWNGGYDGWQQYQRETAYKPERRQTLPHKKTSPRTGEAFLRIGLSELRLPGVFLKS